MDTTIKRRTVDYADLIVSGNPEETLAISSLGSCLAVLLYDPVNGIGGMLHTLLPDSSMEKLPRSSIAFNPYKYVDTGVPKLFDKLYRAGASKSDLLLSVFGGNYGYEEEKYSIGRRNFLALRKVAWREGVLIKNEHVGGRANRYVSFNIEDGRITLDVDRRENFVFG